MVHSSIDDSVINKEVYNKVAHLFTLSFDSKAMHITAVARLRNLIQDPVYWPSLLAMISTAPQETQKRAIRLFSPVFESGYRCLSLRQIISSVLQGALITDTTLWYSILLIERVLWRHGMYSPITLLWDTTHGVRVLQGVQTGADLVLQHLVAWDYLHQVWPTPNSELCSPQTLVRRLRDEYLLPRHELERFMSDQTHLWTFRMNRGEVHKLDPWRHRVISRALREAGIEIIDFLGLSFMSFVLRNGEEHEVPFLHFRLNARSRHALLTIAPTLYEPSESLPLLVVEAYVMALLADVEQHLVAPDETGFVVHPHYAKANLPDSFIQRIERMIGLWTTAMEISEAP